MFLYICYPVKQILEQCKCTDMVGEYVTAKKMMHNTMELRNNNTDISGTQIWSQQFVLLGMKKAYKQ